MTDQDLAEIDELNRLTGKWARGEIETIPSNERFQFLMQKWQPEDVVGMLLKYIQELKKVRG